MLAPILRSLAHGTLSGKAFSIVAPLLGPLSPVEAEGAVCGTVSIEPRIGGRASIGPRVGGLAIIRPRVGGRAKLESC
jgi:hypothetical protein